MNAIIESLNAWGVRFTGFALPMLLQSAILIALLFALDLALRKKVRATIRYAVWMLALVKLALPPSLASPTAAAYWLPPKTVENSYAAPVAIPAMSPVIAPVAAPREIIVNTTYNAADATRASAPWTAAPPSLTWQAGVFAVWLTVAGVMAFWVAWRFWVVLGIIRRSTGSVATVPAMLESCRRQLGVTRDIQVRCAAIGSPAICGVFRPVILLPPGLAENLDEAEMRSVLLHELAHYKRGDLWVNNAQILLQIIYWYNPLLWLANAGIRRAREQAVDEMVLVEMGGEAQTYPATLLHVARLGLGRPAAALGLMGILEPGRGLTQRILHIMNRPLPRTARIGARGLAAVLLLALVALPMACRRKTDAAPPPQPAAPPNEHVLLDVHTKQGDVVADFLAFDDLPLPDGIRQLALLAELNIQLDPALLNQKAADGTPIPPPLLKEKWHQVTPLQAMQALLDNYGWQMEQTPGNPIIRIRARDPKVAGPLTTKVNLLEQPQPPAAKGNTVAASLAFDDIPLPDAIRQLALLVELNVQFDPRLGSPQDANHHPIPSPKVNEKWRNVTPRQALQALLDNYGWQLTQIPGNPILRVSVKEPIASNAAAHVNEAGAATKATPSSDWSGKQVMGPGAMLTPADADALETKLVADPEDFSARRDLLAYYGFRDRAARARHVLWIIEHHPEFSANGPEMSLDAITEASAYRQGKALWLKHVQDQPKNVVILGHAAAFCLLSDRPVSEDLLKQAQVLEPQNPAWSERLGQLYKLNANSELGTNSAVKALAEFEKAQAQTSPAVPGAPRLVELAQMAFAAGDLEKTRAYATELLGPGLHWNRGSNAERAFFYGNIMLGRVALREGKVDEAKKYLLEAGKTKGEPVLDSFGPNMSLAKDLLDKGETNVVLEFFQECEKFWPHYGGENKMAKWAAEVKEGFTPDFGANLVF